MTGRARLILGIAAVLAGTAAAPLSMVAPVAASSWSVTLSASAASVPTGSTVTLTATVNHSLSAGYFIDVDDQTTGSAVDFCDVGTTCQVTVAWNGAGSHTFVAYVDSDGAFEYPPCCVVATSNTVTVSWGQAITWSVSLTASATNAQQGSAVTLTASANASVTGTGNTIAIFDETTGASTGECSTGTTCQVAVSEPAAGAHSFIAYVEADPVAEYPPCCIQAQSNTADVTWHAQATAGIDVVFQATGSLPAFPCPDGCTANFSGSAIGAGSMQAQSGSEVYAATFAMSSGVARGTVSYTEPGFPFCPVDGSATGTVTLSGPAAGSLQRTSTPTETGVVTAATFQLSFTYQRAGATTVITITGGTATIDFTFPDTGPDYFISNVTGAGLGAFAVDPVGAAGACTQATRSLSFTIAGDAALALR